MHFGTIWDSAGLPLSIAGGVVIACIACSCAKTARDKDRRVARRASALFGTTEFGAGYGGEAQPLPRDSSVDRDSVEVPSPRGSRRQKPRGRSSSSPEGSWLERLAATPDGKREQAMLAGLTELSDLERDTVARAYVRSSEAIAEGKELNSFGSRRE